MIQRFKHYARTTAPVLVFLDILRVFLVIFAAFLGILAFRWIATQSAFQAPLHRRLWANPEYTLAGWTYGAFCVIGFVANAAWLSLAVRNFVAITLKRSQPTEAKAKTVDQEKFPLPAYPYNRESFALILGELQDRDGSRVPNERNPELKPRWLVLPELAQYTGLFVTGGIGTGKTAAVANPLQDQMIGFQRPVRVRTASGEIREEYYRYSGLLLDEKGDFVEGAYNFAKKWGRENDVIRIGPGSKTIWNVIYNPNLPTWAVGYQFGWIIKNFNKGASSGDPFWDNAPKELTMDYLTLLYDAEGYYTIFDYLEALIDDSRQDTLNDRAMARFANDPIKVLEMERRWKGIQKRREGMSVNLRGALESCAKAGIDMFKFPELRRTFCPSREEYFTGPCCPWPRRIDVDNERGVQIPQENVFVGFDHVLDYGKILGLQMSKQEWFDAAIFVQVALKSQWQDAVLRRDAVNTRGELIVPPRFGTKIGYCPTFMMADECQANATPRDNEFKAQCRSKRASCIELTQSHSSILDAFGSGKDKAADAYFQNSMTHIYLRQSDIPSMERIQKEIGLKDVAKTSVAITEGGQQSELNYTQGEFINQNLAMSATKTTNIEEKPFLELEELKGLPNNVAVVLPSTGEKVLPATLTYLRPSWVFKKYPHLTLETPWLDWPEEIRKTYDLSSIPQELAWQGWDHKEPLEEGHLVTQGERLGSFIQPILGPIAATVKPTAAATEETAPPKDMPGPVHLMPDAQRPTPEEIQKTEEDREEPPRTPEPEPLAIAEHLERQRLIAECGHQEQGPEEIQEETAAAREGNAFEDFGDDL